MSFDKTKYNADELEFQSKTLCVHFDTQEHMLTLNEFIQTVSSYEVITSNIAETVFKVKKGIKIYILPPQEGSFELSMLLWLSATAVSGIVGSIASDSVKGFIKGVTKRLNAEKFPEGFDFHDSAEILGDTVTGFMLETSQEINEIEKILPPNSNLDIAKKAKADFYAMCSRSKEINGLGFSSSSKSDLKRSDFALRSELPSVKPLPIKVELKELIIVKPVNVEEDLQWDLKDQNTKEALKAKMQDESFKSMLFNGKCPQRQYSTPDVILARVEYHDNLKNGKESKVEYIITDVYKFNSKRLKSTPDNLRLNKKVNLESVEAGKQLDIFENNN